MPPAESELTAAWKATFGEQVSNESLGGKPPQCRTCFLKKSWNGARRLAASAAQKARAGRRLRRASAKAAKPPLAICAHRPV